MKIKLILLFVAFVTADISSLHAQQTKAVFIHGFNGSGEKWVDSGVPQAWKNASVIDGYVIFDYETMELENSSSQGQLLLRLMSEMDAIGNRSDDWILIGHSLGGLVSRVLYPALKSPPIGSTFNIQAVVSIGGPSQGASATSVSQSTISNTVNDVIDNFNNAPEHITVTALLNWLQSFEYLRNSGQPTNTIKDQIRNIPKYLEFARDSALGYTDAIIKTNAESLIGLDGSVINQINNYPTSNQLLHPPNWLSVIGAEKDLVPIRMAGYIINHNDVGSSAVEDLRDEQSVIELYDELIHGYFGRNRRAWRRTQNTAKWCAWIPWSGCNNAYNSAKNNKNKWRTTQSDFENLGTIWAQMANLYRFVPWSHQIWVPPCEGGGGGDLPGGSFEVIDDGGYECSTLPEGEYQTISGYTPYPTKNDGVVTIESVLWGPNDSFNDTHNSYFDDVPHDGGYNHFELRMNSRAYDLDDKPGQPGSGFSLGDENKTIEEVRTWIEDKKLSGW